MIKHLILINSKEGAQSISELVSNGDGFFTQNITVGNKNYFEFFLAHHGTVNKFSFPLNPENTLLLGSGNVVPSMDNNIIELTPVEEFYLPSKTIGEGMISSIKVETEGVIVPGRYGFTLIKKNVPFNERNKYYIEIIIKEDTSYDDFADLLDAKLKLIDVDHLGAINDSGVIKINNTYDDVPRDDISVYTITLDELSAFAFTAAIHNPDDNAGALSVSMLRKLCYECDADYGFNYTYIGGENLYKGKNSEAMFEDLLQLYAEHGASFVSIKVFEPSLYRTLDPRINQSYTFIGSSTAIEELVDAFEGFVSPTNNDLVEPGD